MPGARKLALSAAQAAALVFALFAPAPAAGASGSGGVLVVGDSLEQQTIPYLERYLPDTALTANAVGGYNSNQIFGLFEQSYDPSHSVIVFDAGTNDNPAYPEILAANLNAVAARIGDRCMVVPTVHGLTVDGVGNGGKNAVVRSFAAARPGTQTPDWAGAVAAHPELMQADNLHPVPAGAEHRARLIAAAIGACLGLSRSASEPTLESGPALPPARKFARRQAAIAAAVGGSLGMAIAVQVAAGRPLLGAALAMVSAYA